MSKKDRIAAGRSNSSGWLSPRNWAGKMILPVVSLVAVFFLVRWFLTPSVEYGQKVAEMGRNHIQVGEPHAPYNSNPPTSGPHYEESVPAGVYAKEYADENLVHSLEHGYVIISYNCQVQEARSQNLPPPQRGPAQAGGIRIQESELGAGLVGEVRAHGEEAVATPSGEASPSALSQDESCHRLQDDLKTLAEKLKVWKLIIAPRSQNDTRVALTAWGRIDKFNVFDEKRIEGFVKIHRDQGPERTKD